MPFLRGIFKKPLSASVSEKKDKVHSSNVHRVFLRFRGHQGCSFYAFWGLLSFFSLCHVEYILNLEPE